MLLRSTHRALDNFTARLGRTPERPAHLVAGARGEDEAYFHLRKLGYTIVAPDYRSPTRPCDTDLIAWDKETLSPVDVKTRSSRSCMPTETAVAEEKRQ